MSAEQENIVSLNAGESYLALPDSIVIDNVESFASKVRSLDFITCSKLILDASKVEIITTPGVQIIISLVKCVDAMGTKFELRNPTEAFRKSFETLGFKENLKAWGANG